MAKLRKGVHPHAGAKSWPDGTSAKEIAHFRRVPQPEHHEFADKLLAGELAAASDTSDDDYGERVVYRLAPRRLNTVSEEVAGRVARAIDALLHQYLDSITGYPESGHLDFGSLDELGLSEQLPVSAVEGYFGSFSDEWVDRLLECQGFVLAHAAEWMAERSSRLPEACWIQTAGTE